MEKITYKPLIEHLQQSGDLYNQMYRDSEIRFGAIPKGVIVSWIVQVIQPIVSATSEGKAEQVSKTFQALYKTLLTLLGSQLGVTYEQEYQSAWLMFEKNPHLMQSPLRVVDALNSALVSIRQYQPAKVATWISYMHKTIADCKTIDDFLKCGRIYAWLCGMAYLRDRALRDLSTMGDDFRRIFEKRTGYAMDSTVAKYKMRYETPTFAGVVGGFIGNGGPFHIPPRVALVEDQIIAADNHGTCALFADSFGSMLLPGVPIKFETVHAEATQNPFTVFQSKYGKQKIPFDDVNAAVLKDGVLVLTRESSYYLFVYGWHV